MQISLRTILLGVSVIALALGILCDRASRQRSAVLQLLEYDFVEIEYRYDGDNFTLPENRNHFLETVNSVHLEVTSKEVNKIIPILRRLPALGKICLNFQGDAEQIKSKVKELRKAFPGVEIEVNQYFLRIPVVG